MHNLIKTFREYLAVHPQLQLDGHTMDEIALGLARLVPACEISQTAATGTFSADVPQGVPANLKPSKGCEAAGTSTSASAPKNVPLHVAVAVPDERAAFPAMTPELASILGLMCFQCIPFAQALRTAGHQIETRAEDEQAAVLHWMLGHWFRHGEEWRDHAQADMNRMKDAAQAAEAA